MAMPQTSLKSIFILTTAFAAVVAASRLGYLPFVASTSAFVALLMSYFCSFSSALPSYVYPVAGCVGGLLGFILGMYGSWYVLTLPVTYISNFEYQRMYTWQRVYELALLALSIVGGGLIGLGVRAWRRQVDEPSDPSFGRRSESQYLRGD